MSESNDLPTSYGPPSYGRPSYEIPLIDETVRVSPDCLSRHVQSELFFSHCINETSSNLWRDGVTNMKFSTVVFGIEAPLLSSQDLFPVKINSYIYDRLWKAVSHIEHDPSSIYSCWFEVPR